MKDFAVQPREEFGRERNDFSVETGCRPGCPAAAPGGAWTEPDLTPSRPIYDGRLGELYAIYLRHLVLMLLTLGWSRFWGRTRLRRYLWNHFAILGDRFEYRGRGIELLIGFVLVLLMLAGVGRADVPGLDVRLPRKAVRVLRPVRHLFAVGGLDRLSAGLCRPVCRACATGSRARAGAASAAAWRARPGTTARRRPSSPSPTP